MSSDANHASQTPTLSVQYTFNLTANIAARMFPSYAQYICIVAMASHICWRFILLRQPIESLDDLAKQFKTKYAPQKSTSTETYFRRMADIEEKFYTWVNKEGHSIAVLANRSVSFSWITHPSSNRFSVMRSCQLYCRGIFGVWLRERVDEISNPVIHFLNEGSCFWFIDTPSWKQAMP